MVSSIAPSATHVGFDNALLGRAQESNLLLAELVEQVLTLAIRYD